MKKLNREKVIRMVSGEINNRIGVSSSGGSGGGGLAGAATQAWVNANYVSIEFFSSLFKAYDANGNEVLPNDTETVIDNIKAMFGFWTEQYVSALGQGTGGGGGGGASALSDLLDVEINNPTNGQSLVYDSALSKWVNAAGSGVDMDTVWGYLAQSSTQQIDISHLTTALSGYALKSGNVATATKLQTARTIWGQSFDGTANVSGNMTGVGTISASGDIGVTKSSGETNVFVSNNNGKIGLQTATNRGLWDFTSSKWLIATNGTDSWLNAGNVGIGATSPSYKLHVAGTFYASGNATVGGDLTVNGGDLTVNEPNSSGASAIWFQVGGTTYGNLRVKASNGEFYFYNGTTGDGQSSVCVNAGWFYAYGQVTALSDERKKNVVSEIELTVEQIAQARAVEFYWKDKRDKDLHVGSIAQDWQKILPQAVFEKDGELSMDYSVIALMCGITIARKVVDHERRIAELERENEELKMKLKIA